MMAEYIEREAAFNAILKLVPKVDGDGYCWVIRGDAAAAIDALPAADVRPVRRGKWIDMGDFISCSSCNATRLKEFNSYYGKAKRLDARANFCPNCGADMREES